MYCNQSVETSVALDVAIHEEIRRERVRKVGHFPRNVRQLRDEAIAAPRLFVIVRRIAGERQRPAVSAKSVRHRPANPDAAAHACH